MDKLVDPTKLLSQNAAQSAQFYLWPKCRCGLNHFHLYANNNEYWRS